MSLTLYLLRHGETTFSRDDMYCGSGTDADLTEKGVKMAEAFGKAYSSLKWEGIYSSPLKRTRATVEPLVKVINAPIVFMEEFREIGYGKWEGKTRDQVLEEFGDAYHLWNSEPGWNAPTDGETGVEIEERARHGLSQIMKKHSSGNVLVVSHKATIRILLCSLLGIDLGRYRHRLDCPVASVSVIEFSTHGPLLLRQGDRAHLSGLNA